MSANTLPPFRADHVGSFLRPKALLDARTAFREGSIDAAARPAPPPRHGEPGAAGV
mgnify:CR=1 FL=1